MDVRKARKMVMKSKIVLNITYKTHIKNVRIFDHEKKIWIEINFPFKRKAYHVYRVGYGRGRIW